MIYKYRFRIDHTREHPSRPHVVTAKVWLYPGAAAWYFATLPKILSKKLRTQYGHTAKGWGSLPVEVTLGRSTWRTSIFPDKKAGAYLLPLKADIRKAESIKKADRIRFRLTVRP